MKKEYSIPKLQTKKNIQNSKYSCSKKLQKTCYPALSKNILLNLNKLKKKIIMNPLTENTIKINLPNMNMNISSYAAVSIRTKIQINQTNNVKIESSLKKSRKSQQIYKRQKFKENSMKYLSINNFLNEKNQLYYISDIKKDFDQYVREEREILTVSLSHFLSSIATFHIFRDIKIPNQPHIQLNLPIPIEKKEITLIFDMDQTLLHCSTINNQIYSSQQTITINLDNNEVQLALKIRPYARQVLKRLSHKFQIGLFTAGRQPYANSILNIFDPNNQYFSFRLFRQHCYPYNHSQNKQTINIKDLRILKNRQLNKVVLIDNSAHTFLFQPENAIPIISYYGDQKDTQLLKLQRFLGKISNIKDIRCYLKQLFKFKEYCKYDNGRELIQNLY